MDLSSDLSAVNKDYLICYVCTEMYEHPKVLSCHHTFCKACLDLSEKTGKGSYILCPVCRQKTLLGLNGVAGLRSNLLFENMINMLNTIETSKTDADETDAHHYTMCHTCPESQAAMATYQCIECLDQLCADCAAFHSRTKLTKDHEVVSIEEIENGMHKQKIKWEKMARCKVHQMLKLEQYCQDCDILVCHDCVIELHQTHRLAKISEAIQSIIHEITEMRIKVQHEMHDMNRTLEEVEETEETEQSLASELEKDIAKATQEFINKITECRDQMITQVRENISAKLEHIQTTKDRLKTLVADSGNLLTISDCAVKEGIPCMVQPLRVKISTHIKETQKNFKELQQINNEHVKGFTKLRFLPGDIEDSTKAGMGRVDEIKLVHTSTADEENVFETEDDTTEIDKQTGFPDGIYEESLYANYQQTDVTLVKKPTIAQRSLSASRMPVAAPRQRPESIIKLDTTQKPIKLPKPTVMVKPNLTKMPDCYKLTRIKGTVPLPTEKQVTAMPKDGNKAVARITPCRTAPAPPPPPQKAKPIGVQVLPNTSPKHRRTQSHDPLMSKTLIKKSLAPLPPLKIFAELQLTIGAHREFQGPPTDAIFFENNIIVLDGEARKLVIFNKYGKVIKNYKLAETKTGQERPQAIHALNQKQLCVLFSTFVGIYASNGNLTKTFGHGDLIDACDLTVNNQGQVIILDHGKSDVFVFDEDGTKLMKFGGNGDKEHLHEPRYICTTDSGEILVADHETNSIQMFEKNGKFITSLGDKGDERARMNNPSGMDTACINKQEVILVADEGNNRIAAFDKRGRFITDLVSNEPRLQSPQHITVHKNRIIVTQRNCFLSTIFEMNIK